MKRKSTKQPDYPKMVEQILAAGVSQIEFGAALGIAMTDRMLVAYRGLRQPLPSRAAAIESLWLKTTGKKRIPMTAAA